MNVKVQLFSIPQKVFGEKKHPNFPLLSEYFTDQSNIQKAKRRYREQSDKKEKVSTALSIENTSKTPPQF